MVASASTENIKLFSESKDYLRMHHPEKQV
jgi:hypothetical protein